MSSIREKYFELKKIDSKYLNENIIKQLLMLVNDIESDFDLLTSFDNECKKLDLLTLFSDESVDNTDINDRVKNIKAHKRLH